ncbi:MAG: two pore domain potassium channel family protein, partial [Planctomycetes bacterium]|nr:two pore domain potassium channel family protein [Planctomycetota bacterium]
MHAESGKNRPLVSLRPERHWACRLGWPVGILIGFIIVATVGYQVLHPDRSWLDALYMTIISVTTVGLREVYEVSEAGMVWTLIVIANKLVTGAVTMSMIVA